LLNFPLPGNSGNQRLARPAIVYQGTVAARSGKQVCQGIASANNMLLLWSTKGLKVSNSFLLLTKEYSEIIRNVSPRVETKIFVSALIRGEECTIDKRHYVFKAITLSDGEEKF
jgi:hypothetical protein